MALHSSDNHTLGTSPFGTVMTEGYSLDLGLDQFGIFSKAARKTTKKGLKVISSFEGIDKQREKLALLFGTKKDTGLLGSGKDSRSVDFSLSDIKRVGISNPQNTEQKFDYWRVGWNGLDSKTSLKFFRGQSLEFQMTFKGAAATFFNTTDEYTVKVPVVVENFEYGTCSELGDLCDPVDCRENTLKLVKDLNNYSLPTGQKLSDYFDIYPIFETPSTNSTPVVYNQWCLDYCGFGGEYELSAVSAQYPGYEVKRDTFTNKFVLFAPSSYTPAPFVQKKGDILKGCDSCPKGYDLVPEGILYAVALEDDGVDQKSIVQGLPGAVVGSALKLGQDFGVGHYIVVLDNELTNTEEKTFITANPTAILVNAGTKSAFCTIDEEITHAWVNCGSCSASQAKYRLVVADDCNGSRLADVREAYPDLTITQIQHANCLSVFETTVMTDFKCNEGCNPAIIEQVFSSQAPRPFGINNYWFPYTSGGTPVDSGACGFEIKAKPIILNPSTYVEDSVPFIMTSSRIVALSGGYPIDYSMNTMVPQNAWTVTQLERAKDLDNLGASLKGWEKKGRFYFSNEKPYRDLLTREMTGTYSRLDNMTQYSDLYIEIEKSNKAGINSKEYTYITYHVYVPFGKTSDMEKVLQKLSGAAGVPFEVK